LIAVKDHFQYETYLLEFEWLGQHLLTRILVGAGKECLIGTALLNPHQLTIDYETRSIDLRRGKSW
jgi:hypothetical protein